MACTIALFDHHTNHQYRANSVYIRVHDRHGMDHEIDMIGITINITVSYAVASYV